MLLKCDKSVKEPNFTVVDASKEAEFVSVNTKCKVKISKTYIILIMTISMLSKLGKWPSFQLILTKFILSFLKSANQEGEKTMPTKELTRRSSEEYFESRTTIPRETKAKIFLKMARRNRK